MSAAFDISKSLLSTQKAPHAGKGGEIDSPLQIDLLSHSFPKFFLLVWSRGFLE